MRSLFLEYRKEDGCKQRKDGVELRECGVNKCVDHYVVALAYADDTICTYLTLADGRDQADDTYAETDTEIKRTGSCDVL